METQPPRSPRPPRAESDLDPAQVAGLALVPLSADRGTYVVLHYDPAAHVAVIRRRWHGARRVFALRLPAPDPARVEWVPVYSAHMGPAVLEYNPSSHRVRVWKDIGGEKRRIPVRLPPHRPPPVTEPPGAQP